MDNFAKSKLLNEFSVSAGMDFFDKPVSRLVEDFRKEYGFAISSNAIYGLRNRLKNTQTKIRKTTKKPRRGENLGITAINNGGGISIDDLRKLNVTATEFGGITKLEEAIAVLKELRGDN